MNRCLLCEGPELEEYRLCSGCTRATLNRLHRAPRLYRALEMLLPPASRPPRLDSGGSGAAEAPLPMSVELLDLRGPGGIVGTLEDWHAALAEDRGWGVPVVRGSIETRLQLAASRLAASIEWIAASWPAAGDFAREIRDLEHGVLSMISPPERDRRLGYCATAVDGVLCGSVVRLPPGETVATCSWCRTPWGPDRWMELRAAQDQFEGPQRLEQEMA
ncbi:hypothetical protein [Actinacidiphila sp. ITFR-21]|uniref:hypothetical protein n=1 Tax=Actinacidiphila sp. ITFR-21 TaxID=3075199 RepID=UPI00288C27C1|nr:hypothetical protein [Streptomyces sp. ITFR-21]WNI16936.1 hypothetical protein RLT57_16330 [Streptomyces sp. ITFR-21]